MIFLPLVYGSAKWKTAEKEMGHPADCLQIGEMKISVENKIVAVILEAKQGY